MRISNFNIISRYILGKVISLIGYVVGAFSLLIEISGIFFMDEHDGGTITVMIVFAIILLGCMALIRLGSRIKHLIKRFKRYVSLITNDHASSLQDLAYATSQPVDFVQKDIREMILKKFFLNLTINPSTRELLISNTSPQVLPTETENVTCSGCGALNAKPKGLSSVCEYCGSPL